MDEHNLFPAGAVDEWVLTTDAVGSGSVDRLPNLAYYPDGTQVTLSATPDTGYIFDHWEGDLSGTANPHQISMTADRNLVDEQTVAADPRAGSGGAVATTWMPSWHQIDYPCSCYIDLGQTYNITDIYIYDQEWKNGDFSVSYGSPGNWVVLFTDGLNRNNQWFGQTTNLTTRYLRFTRHTPTSFVNEILVYGSTGAADTTPPAQISDLAAVPVTTTSVALNWTATGDDGPIGTRLMILLSGCSTIHPIHLRFPISTMTISTPYGAQRPMG